MTDGEITKRAAEKVMGWELLYLTETDYPSGPHYKTPESYIPLDNWDPLHDLNHAFMVVGKMRELGFNFNLNWQAHPGITTVIAQFHMIDPFKHGQGYDDNNQVGRAICLAALKAVGIQSV